MAAPIWVSIVELVFYIPTSILALFVCSKHGFRRSSGWIYTLILCIIRMTGAICFLVGTQNHNEGLLRTAITLDSVGVSPLLLATVGMLSRFFEAANARSATGLTTKHIRILQILIHVALILSIAGGTSTKISSSGDTSLPSTSKIAIVLYIVGLVGIAFMYAIATQKISQATAQERRILFAVLVAFPFIVVRLLYSICTVFVHDKHFNIVTGSVTIRFVMGILEEFIVVVVYLGLGFSLDKMSIGVTEEAHLGMESGVVGGKQHRGRYDETTR